MNLLNILKTYKFVTVILKELIKVYLSRVLLKEIVSKLLFPLEEYTISKFLKTLSEHKISTYKITYPPLTSIIK